MSSSQERKGGIESWSLRRRLIFEQIVLLALVCVIIVLVTEVALRAFLVGQLDDRLMATKLGPAGPPGGDITKVRGQGPGPLNALIDHNGQVMAAGRFSTSTGEEDLPATEYATLLNLPADGHIYVRDLGGDFGEYRMTAVETPEGLVITGLPMSEVNDILL